MVPFLLALQLTGVAAPPAPPLPPDLTLQEDPYAPPPRAPTPSRPQGFSSGFGRFQLGLGPPSFSPESSLLRLDGYAGSKLWIELDGGYMIGALGRHFGGGVWGGIGRWFSPGSGTTPSLVEVDYLVGIEFPVRFGTRALAVMAAPRIGLASGTIDLGGEAPSQEAFVWGAQLSALSSRYHLSASMSYLSARVDRPAAIGLGLGLDHDLGGLYFSLGALLDDG
jgi:hypothetical protein